MPTASKLFGAFAFALVGFFAAEMVKDSFPDEDSFGYFSLICLLLGVIVGWKVMGPSARPGTGAAIKGGLKTSVVLLLAGLFVFSVYEMLRRSIDRRYDGVMEALEGTFIIMLEYGQIVAQSIPTLVVLVVGGILGGMFSCWAAARWS